MPGRPEHTEYQQGLEIAEAALQAVESVSPPTQLLEGRGQKKQQRNRNEFDLPPLRSIHKSC